MNVLKAYYQIPFAGIDCSIRQVQMRCILNNDFGDWKFWDRRKQVWPMGRSKLENRGLLMELCRKTNCNPEFLKYLLTSKTNSSANCMCNNAELSQNNLPSVPLSEYKCGYVNYDWFPQYVRHHLYKNSADAEKPKIFEKINRDWLDKLYELYNSTVGKSSDDELENLVKELRQRYLKYLYRKQLENANKYKEIEDTNSAEETEQNEEKTQIRISLNHKRISLNQKRMSRRLSRKNVRKTAENIFDTRHNIKETSAGRILPAMFGRRGPGTPPTRQSMRPSQSALSFFKRSSELLQSKQTKRKSQQNPLNTLNGNKTRQSLQAKLLMALLKTGSTPQISNYKLLIKDKNIQNNSNHILVDNDYEGFDAPYRRSTVRFNTDNDNDNDSDNLENWRIASNQQGQRQGQGEGEGQGQEQEQEHSDENLVNTKSSNRIGKRPIKRMLANAERNYDRMKYYGSNFTLFNANKMTKRKLVKEQPDTPNTGRVSVKFGRSNLSRMSSQRNAVGQSRTIKNFLEEGYGLLNKIVTHTHTPLEKRS